MPCLRLHVVFVDFRGERREERGGRFERGYFGSHQQGVGATALGLAESLSFQGNGRTQTEYAANGGTDNGLHLQTPAFVIVIVNVIVFPFHVNLKATTGTKALHLSLVPGIGKGRKQMDRSVMTLQEHLGDACRGTKIAVNLERRMGIEEIGERTALGILEGSAL